VRTIASGSSAKVRGVIVSRDGDLMRIREEADSVVTVALSSTTKVTMKHGLFKMSHTGMEVTSLVPGLRVEAEGTGNEKGELQATKVSFDPNDMKSARSIDTRVAPLEARTGAVEGRAGQLEGRAGQLESRSTDLEGRSKNLEGKTGELDDKLKQTDQQVAVVGDSANKANTGVNTLGGRVNALDDYETKGSATVYFAVKSTKLTEKAKQELDALIQSVKDDKGFMIEVAGFADSTGNVEMNQELSQKRAQAVVQYLQEVGNVPLRRILAPAGLGTSHSVADNHTREGRQQNRRVEVRVLVNRGITG
jgi:outer membrane protein OmpA-like peptidoglycan-associated protein